MVSALQPLDLKKINQTFFENLYVNQACTKSVCRREIKTILSTAQIINRGRHRGH